MYRLQTSAILSKKQWVNSQKMTHTIYKVFVVICTTRYKTATKMSPSSFCDYGNIHLPASLAVRPFTSSGLVQIISSTHNHPIHNMYACTWGMQYLVYPREPLQCHGLFFIATSTVANRVALSWEKWITESLFDDKLTSLRYGVKGGKQNLVIWFSLSANLLSFGKWISFKDLVSEILLSAKSRYRRVF